VYSYLTHGSLGPQESVPILSRFRRFTGLAVVTNTQTQTHTHTHTHTHTARNVKTCVAIARIQQFARYTMTYDKILTVRIKAGKIIS